MTTYMSRRSNQSPVQRAAWRRLSPSKSGDPTAAESLEGVRNLAMYCALDALLRACDLIQDRPKKPDCTSGVSRKRRFPPQRNPHHSRRG